MGSRAEILATMVYLGTAVGAVAGGISCVIIGALIFAPNSFAIIFGAPFGGFVGVITGAILGAIIGFVAGIITMIFRLQTEKTLLYRLTMASICTLLSAILVFTTAQRFFDLERTLERPIIIALTLLGALFGLVFSSLFAIFNRKLVARFGQPRTISVTSPRIGSREK